MTTAQQATLQQLHDRLYGAKLRLKDLKHDHAPRESLEEQRERVDQAEIALRAAEREEWR